MPIAAAYGWLFRCKDEPMNPQVFLEAKTEIHKYLRGKTQDKKFLSCNKAEISLILTL